MNIKFARLFEVNISHTYYITKISPDFEIAPTFRCQEQLQNYKLLFRKTATGFIVLYEVNQDGNPLIPIAENVKFSFVLKSKNPYLHNFTNLPLDSQPNDIFYLHNNRQNGDDGNDDLQLTSKNVVSQRDRLELRPQFFQYGYESSNPTSSSTVYLEILDEFMDTLLQKTVALVEGVLNYPVDLRGHEPGKFILKIDGSEMLIFYADDDLFGQNIFGVVDVYRNEQLEDAYEFVDTDNGVIPKLYTVKLRRRKTFWRYHIIPKYSTIDEPENITIERSNQSPAFNRQGERVNIDGLQAVVFKSENDLPHRENPIKNIKLNKIKGKRENTLIEDLPNPSIMTLPKPQDTNDEIKYYSDIFVYI